MKKTEIEVQEMKRCQDSRNTMVKFGSKIIPGVGGMYHVTSRQDLSWIFDLDYDHDHIEGLIMPVWMSSTYLDRLDEASNQRSQTTIEGGIALSPIQVNFLDFVQSKLIAYDPSSEVFYFDSKIKNKKGKESFNQKKKALASFCDNTNAPKPVLDLLTSTPQSYYEKFEKVYNDSKQRVALTTWSLVTQKKGGADICFAPTPYVSGNETAALKVAVEMNREAEILIEGMGLPMAHYYCLDGNFFADSDVVDAAIELFTDTYLKFDKSYQRIVAIKIVNDRFASEPDMIDNLKNLMHTIRQIREKTGVVFVLLNSMSTGYACLSKGIDFYSFPTNGHTAAGFIGGSGVTRAGLYDSKQLVKRKYPSVLKYYSQNGHIPVEGSYGMSIGFNNPEELSRDEWNLQAKKILAEVKNNEIKKMRDAINNGDVRIIREVFLASRVKGYYDLI